jgi:hypothetical protein
MEHATQRDLVFHLDRLFHARAHVLLVVNAILLAAAALRWENVALRRGIAALGVALVVLVFVANVNLANKLRWSMARWEETDASGFVREYVKQRVRFGGRELPRSINIYAYAIPILLLAGWAAALMR